MKTIKLPYSPNITQEKVIEILEREYPGKKVSKLLGQVRIKENALRFANVSINHNERKNLTQIGVSAAMPIWMGATIIIPIVFVGLGLYALCGNWALSVSETLKRKLTTL